ncbi:MAG: zf-HC2 domain-containing protein [Actinomycetota bacterium]
MTRHEDDEAISAYLDGVLDASERGRVEEHLRSCPDCTARRETLERTMAALASLPDAPPTADESRAIRLAVLERTGAAPTAARRPLIQRLFPALAGVALLIAGVVGFVLLRPTRPSHQAAERQQVVDKAATSAGAGAQGPLELTSGEQVRDVVLAQPEVAGAGRKFTVADVGRRQEHAVASVASRYSAKGGDTNTGGAPAAPALPSTTGSTDAARSAQSSQVRSLEDCLAATLETQPYPLMPLLARPAFYQAEPVYLLVYAWTTSTDGEARLDRLQAWLVTQTDCTPRHYSQFAAP